VRRRLLIGIPLVVAVTLVVLGLVGRRAMRDDGPGPGAGGLEHEGPRIGDEVLAEATRFPTDPTLKDRVESELFRDPSLPKGDVLVDAAYGVVTLRGRVPGDRVDEIAARVAAIEGVTRVENLLRPR
jgi:hypothetical protein